MSQHPSPDALGSMLALLLAAASMALRAMPRRPLSLAHLASTAGPPPDSTPAPGGTASGSADAPDPGEKSDDDSSPAYPLRAPIREGRTGIWGRLRGLLDREDAEPGAEEAESGTSRSPTSATGSEAGPVDLDGSLASGAALAASYAPLGLDEGGVLRPLRPEPLDPGAGAPAEHPFAREPLLASEATEPRAQARSAEVQEPGRPLTPLAERLARATAATGRVHALAAALAAAEAERDSSRDELAKERHRASRIETELHEVSSHAGRMRQSLEAERDAAREESQTYRERLARIEAEQLSRAAEMARLRQALEAERDTARADAGAQRERLARLETELADLEGQWTRQRKELEAERDAARLESASQRQRASRLESELAELTGIHARVRGELESERDAQHDEAELHRQRADQLASELEAAASALAESRAALQAERQRAERLRAELEHSRRVLDETQVDLRTARLETQAARDERRALADDRDRANRTRDAALTRLEAAERDLRLLMEALVGAEASSRSAVASLRDSEERLTALADERVRGVRETARHVERSLLARLGAAERERDEATRALRDLFDRIEHLEAEVARAEAALTARLDGPTSADSSVC